MKKAAFVILSLVVFCLMGTGVCAAEETQKETGAQLIGEVMKRGAINLFTFPGEVVRTAAVEKENHPKAVYATYVPKLLSNLATRAVSLVNDLGVMPWYVWATKDKRPITNFFDMPDYVWEKL